MSLLDLLAQRQFVIVTGKGGVGKSTVAALLGRALAARGLRTLILEADPRESLHQLFGTEPSGGERVPVGQHLWIQNLQPKAIIEELVNEKVPIGFFARRITHSATFHHFVAGAPGFKETALLGHAFRVVTGRVRPRCDLVILDAPATGHGLTLLTAPGLLAEAVQGGQISTMARELAEFLGDQDRCAIVLATLAEEMPVQETLELIDQLQVKLGRAPELIAANALFPPFPEVRPEGPSVLVDLWRDRRAVNERELQRLCSAWNGPLIELPQVGLDRGPRLLEALKPPFEAGCA